jgi:hypothetical protein
VPISSPPEAEGWFPLFAVIVGPKDFPLYNGPEWGAPYGSSHIIGRPAPDQRFSIRGNQFPLDETTDVQIAAAWIPGRMTIPMILTSPRQ